MEFLILVNGVNYAPIDNSIFSGYKWNLLKPGERIFNGPLGWNSKSNCGRLKSFDGTNVVLTYNQTAQDPLEEALKHLE